MSIGQGAVNLIDPPSGSLVANFEGAENVSTLTCNVLNSGEARTTTNWFLQNFRSNPGLVGIAVGEFTELFFIAGDVVPTDPPRTYRNELTFLNFTSDLDGVTVFCGTATNRQQGSFTLRVYRKFVIDISKISACSCNFRSCILLKYYHCTIFILKVCTTLKNNDLVSDDNHFIRTSRIARQFLIES